MERRAPNLVFLKLCDVVNQNRMNILKSSKFRRPFSCTLVTREHGSASNRGSTTSRLDDTSAQPTNTSALDISISYYLYIHGVRATFVCLSVCNIKNWFCSLILCLLIVLEFMFFRNLYLSFCRVSFTSLIYNVIALFQR